MDDYSNGTLLAERSLKSRMTSYGVVYMPPLSRVYSMLNTHLRFSGNTMLYYLL